MATALDPNREATLAYRFERRLAERRAKRVDRSRASQIGHVTRRVNREPDPILSDWHTT